ncbi:MAG TPA: hypothetical protein PL070_05950 [Flavobacteriales bacterium]|nr:hypothetical protein [Flavobacteriales bacterium]
MKRLAFISFLFILSGAHESLGQTSDLADVVDRIAKINEVQGEHVGFAGIESENYKSFIQLKGLATINELVQLTDNDNATVSCYASWALADIPYAELPAIFAKFILRDREVETFRGCIKSQDIISSSLYHRYWNSVNQQERPTDRVLIELDSIVLFNHSPNWLLLSRALENRTYTEPYKEQIALLAFEQGRKEAILYLSTWHRAEYVNRIKPALVAYLKNTSFKNTGTTDYYRTIEELFKFNDAEIRKVIITKMKKDRHWEKEKGRFMYLLGDNYIYNIDNE